MLDKITIHLSKAANGQDYVQISSPAAIPVNIVLVASQIVVEDKRPPAPKTPPRHIDADRPEKKKQT